MHQRKGAYCLDEVTKHGTKLRTRKEVITTVRARIVTKLEVMNVVEVVETIIETMV